MRFTQDQSSNVNVIRGYGPGELRINEEIIHESVILATSSMRTAAGFTTVSALTADHAAQLLDLRPELVLIGTGEQQTFPAPAFGAIFLKAGVGFEVMNTGAACRTFNVLVSEHRQVVALLML